MSWSSYCRAVIADRPTVFYPAGVGQDSNILKQYAMESRVTGDLSVYTGTPTASRRAPARPGFYPFDPYVQTGADDLYISSVANVNTTELTMECWAWVPSGLSAGTDYEGFILAQTGTPGGGLRIYNNNWECFIGNTGGNTYDNITYPHAGMLEQWVHWVATYNGNTRTLRMTLNGVSCGTQGGAGSGSRMGASQQIFLGRYNASFALRWPTGGGITCCSLYDRYDPLMGARHYRAAIQQRVAA